MPVQFTFAWSQAPWWFIGAAAALLLTAAALRHLERRREARLHRFVEADLAPRLLAGHDPRLRRPLFWLILLGVAMLGLAFAEPRWGRSWVSVSRGSRDVLVLLDVSLSMTANDLPPSRLERARHKIEALLKACPGDRFGLIAFAGEAKLICPLTLDHGYFRTILGATGPDSVSVLGTDITLALDEAAKAFEEDIRQSGRDSRHARAVVLISDGEQVSGDAIAKAKQLGPFAMIGVMGIGNPEGVEIRMPEWMAAYTRGRVSKEPRISRLDEKTLTGIALESGGVYVRLTPDNADIQRIHQEMEYLTTRAVSDEVRFTLVNRYRWPLAVAMLCFAAEGLWRVIVPWLLRRRVRRLAAESEEAGYV